MVLGLLFANGILELLHTKDELIEGAALYLRIYFLGMPALAIYNFGNAVFSAVGNTKKPLYYLATAGVINIILNLFFVIACKLDVLFPVRLFPFWLHRIWLPVHSRHLPFLSEDL